VPDYALNIRRFDPESGGPPRWQQFDVELEDHLSVLDGVLQARGREDGSIGIRCSCRAAICGSCGVRINGKAALACNTRISDAAAKAGDEPITVEPMGNMPVLKDLIVDMDAVHWKKVREVVPWLLPDGPTPEREHVVPAEAMVDVTQTMACIHCGVCVSDCLSLEVDPDFVGPAALAKAYRFVGDPRDGQTEERLHDLAENPHGIYDCTHCFSCVEVCPKGVAPMDQIMRLRRRATHDFGINDQNNGKRHEAAFTNIIRKKGVLDERKLFQDSMGVFRPKGQLELLRGLPTGLRGFLRGKMSAKVALFHEKIPGVDNLKRIYGHAEDHREELNLYIEGEENDSDSGLDAGIGSSEGAATTDVEGEPS
jgi:succinate dehydrogenase / fumarate reductase iron-sulfur subunit